MKPDHNKPSRFLFASAAMAASGLLGLLLAVQPLLAAVAAGGPGSATPTHGILLALILNRPSIGDVDHLLITEVLYDPSESQGEVEWIEIFNPTGDVIALDAYKVGDEETLGGGEGMYAFPAGSQIGVGQVVVIVKNATDFAAAFGFNPDFEFSDSGSLVPEMVKYGAWAGGSVTLTNTGDEVLLLDVFDDPVDAVSWGSSNWAFDPDTPVVQKSHSIERIPGYVDTDTALDWGDQPLPTPGEADTEPPSPTASPTLTATSTTTASPTNTASPITPATPTNTASPSPSPTASPSPSSTSSPSPTPTASKTPTPFMGGLLISEVVYDPDGPESAAEWFEIHNTTGSAIPISGFKVGDEEVSGGSEGMYEFPEGSHVPAGGVVVVANQAVQFEMDHGWKPDFELTDTDPDVPDLIKYTVWAGGSISLSNTGDELLLLDTADHLVDAVSWADSTWAFDPPVPDVSSGHSIERFPAGIDTDTAADWRDQGNPTPGSLP